MLHCAGSEVRKLKIRNMVLCALFAALMAVCAWLAFPLGSIVFTLQSFAVFLALLTLGGGRGTAAILVYLLLGAVGLPVFSGFRGGLGALFGITGGYLWGFAVSALVFWLITGVFGQKLRIPAVFVAMLCCYGCGMIWMAFSQLGGFTPDALKAAFFQGVLPYLLPDTAKLVLAFFLSSRLKRFV